MCGSPLPHSGQAGLQNSEPSWERAVVWTLGSFFSHWVHSRRLGSGVGCEWLPGLLGCEFLFISARIRLMELYCLSGKPNFFVKKLTEGCPFGFVGQRVG